MSKMARTDYARESTTIAIGRPFHVVVVASSASPTTPVLSRLTDTAQSLKVAALNRGRVRRTTDKVQHIGIYANYLLLSEIPRRVTSVLYKNSWPLLNREHGEPDKLIRWTGDQPHFRFAEWLVLLLL